MALYKYGTYFVMQAEARFFMQFNTNNNCMANNTIDNKEDLK